MLTSGMRPSKLLPTQTHVRFLQKAVINATQYEPGVATVLIEDVPGLLVNGIAEALEDTIVPAAEEVKEV